MSAEDATREIDPITGYPRLPDSSPASGAGTEGKPPAPEPTESRHEPDPGSPRWNEVYRNWKESDRENADLRRELDDLRSKSATPGPQPAPAAQTNDADDGMGWFWERLDKRLDERLTPISRRLEEQRQSVQAERTLAEFRQNHPDFDQTRDGPMVLSAMRRYGVQNLEAGYRLAFPERAIGSPKGREAPVADVRSAPTGETTGTAASELLRRFHATTNVDERQAIMSMLEDMNVRGAIDAERALGMM